MTALMLALRNGYEKEAHKIIDKSSNINTRDAKGWTALMYAARYSNSTDILMEIIRKKAEINLKNNAGWTVNGLDRFCW